MRVKAPFMFEKSSKGLKLFCFRMFAVFETIRHNGSIKRDVLRMDTWIHEHDNGFACDGKCGVR